MAGLALQAVKSNTCLFGPPLLPDLAVGHHLQGLPPGDNLLLPSVSPHTYADSFMPLLRCAHLPIWTKAPCLGSASLPSHYLFSFLLPTAKCPSLLSLLPHLPPSLQPHVTYSSSTERHFWKIMEPYTTLPKPSNSLLTPKRQPSLKLGIQGPSGLVLCPLISHPSYTLQHPRPSIPSSTPAHSPQTYLSLIYAPLPYFLPSTSLSLGFSIYKGIYLNKLIPEFPPSWL